MFEEMVVWERDEVATLRGIKESVSFVSVSTMHAHSISQISPSIIHKEQLQKEGLLFVISDI